MAAMIRRISRLSLLESSSVYIRTATPTRSKALGSGLSRSFAPTLITQRSHAFGAYTTVIFNQNSRYATANIKSSGNGEDHRPYIQLSTHQQRREFSSSSPPGKKNVGVRFSTLLTRHLGLSRRQAERMILTERVTFFGKIMNNPAFELFPSNDPNQDSSTAMKVDGKLVHGVVDTLKKLQLEQLKNNEIYGAPVNANDTKADKQKKETESIDYSNTRIWLANKLKGELITEDDPVGRPSMLQRLARGGVGKSTKKGVPPIHLKPVGRLDMMTEGLMIFSNDGKYARQMELPTNLLWRTYRVRVHGRLTMGKLNAMRRGLTVRVNDNVGGSMDKKPSGEVVQTGKLMRYKGIKVSIERKNSYQRDGRGGGGTNTWLQITCTEGKNRQLRRILGALGLDVTRLVRISYGDYDLNTIPPGRAIEVNYKDLEGMKKKGQMFSKSHKAKKKEVVNEKSSPGIQWVNHS